MSLQLLATLLSLFPWRPCLPHTLMAVLSFAVLCTLHHNCVLPTTTHPLFYLHSKLLLSYTPSTLLLFSKTHYLKCKMQYVISTEPTQYGSTRKSREKSPPCTPHRPSSNDNYITRTFTIYTFTTQTSVKTLITTIATRLRAIQRYAAVKCTISLPLVSQRFFSMLL